MARKILIMGLPGAGKTTLATVLAKRLGAVHYNADFMREHINKDLDFSMESRLEQAARMGKLCDLVVASGTHAIADFVCPTTETRRAFNLENVFLVFVDRIKSGRFEDPNKLFDTPALADYTVQEGGSPEFHAERIANMIQPAFDWQKPTALFLGRYQPFHEGHVKLIEEGLQRVGQVCIAVRDTGGTDNKNPFGYAEVASRIETRMKPYAGKFVVCPVPNITNIFYGRDVGYAIERIDLDAATQAVSATDIRKKIGLV